MTDLLTRPIYSYADADRIAAVSRGTSKRWIEGYTRKRADGTRTAMPPISSHRDGHGPGVSFTELIEIVCIGEFKKLGFSVQKVRSLVSACREVFGFEYPLTQARFKTDGRSIFIQKEGVLYSVLKGSAQAAWDEILSPFLKTLDYTDGRAYRWWPMGKTWPVVVDPRYGYGLPVIAGSGVRTEIIVERLRVGDPKEEIAYDFNVSCEEVESALKFELQRAA